MPGPLTINTKRNTENKLRKLTYGWSMSRINIQFSVFVESQDGYLWVGKTKLAASGLAF